MSEERIDATDQQIAQAFADLRQRLVTLPQQLDFMTDRLEQAVERLTESNQALPELEELVTYRTAICDDLRAAMRLALVFDAEMPSCSRLANALEAIGNAPDYKQFVFGAGVELDQMRAAFEREAEKAKPSESLHWKQRLLALHDAAKERNPETTDAEIIAAFSATEADRKTILSEQRGKPKPIEVTMRQAIRRHRREQQS